MADSTRSPFGDRPAGDLAATGKQQVEQVVAEAKARTSQLLDEASGTARDRLDSQISQLAGKLDQISGQLDEMAVGVPDSDSGGYATAVARAGSKAAHSLSQRLEDGGLDGLIDDIRRFADRRPAAFCYSTFGVGLLVGRLTRGHLATLIGGAFGVRLLLRRVTRDTDLEERGSGDDSGSSDGPEPTRSQSTDGEAVTQTAASSTPRRPEQPRPLGTRPPGNGTPVTATGRQP